MLFRRHRPIAAIIVAVALGVSIASCDKGTSNVPATKLLELINQKRVAAGCPTVSGNDKLRVAAERHVVDMRDHNAHLQPGTDGHTGSDGSTPQKRITDAGYTPSKYGEIIYWSNTASDETTNVDWWMNSPPHKAIMLDCGYQHAGVGVVYPAGAKWYSVVDFGAP